MVLERIWYGFEMRLVWFRYGVGKVLVCLACVWDGSTMVLVFLGYGVGMV